MGRNATAALKAGISPKIISERLGHATAAFTLQVYSHVIPGMDEDAATSVAALILGHAEQDSERGVRNLVRNDRVSGSENEADLGESPGQRQ